MFSQDEDNMDPRIDPRLYHEQHFTQTTPNQQRHIVPDTNQYEQEKQRLIDEHAAEAAALKDQYKAVRIFARRQIPSI